MSRLNFHRWREMLQTSLTHFRATAGKGATAHLFCRPRHTLADAQRFRLQRGIRHRHRRDQRLGIRVLRVGDHLVARADLHHITQIHHRDAVTGILQQREVVGNVDRRQAHLPRQAPRRIQNPRSHRNIQHRYWLIRHQKIRVQHQRPRQHHALQLPTAELMRVLIQEKFRRLQIHPLQSVQNARQPFLFVLPAMDDERLGQRAIERKPRVERFERVLEHQLHPPAECQLRPSIQMRQLRAIEDDLPRARLDQLDEQLAGRRLPAAGFTRQAQALAAPQGEGDFVDGIKRLFALPTHQTRQTATNLEALGDSPHIEQDLLRRFPTRRSVSVRRCSIGRFRGDGAEPNLACCFRLPPEKRLLGLFAQGIHFSGTQAGGPVPGHNLAQGWVFCSAFRQSQGATPREAATARWLPQVWRVTLDGNQRVARLPQIGVCLLQT